MSSLYIEVRNSQGRFFVEGNSALWPILRQVIHGGHSIELLSEDMRTSVREQQ